MKLSSSRFFFFLLEAEGHLTSSSLLDVDSVTVRTTSSVSGVMSCCSVKRLAFAVIAKPKRTVTGAVLLMLD